MTEAKSPYTNRPKISNEEIVLSYLGGESCQEIAKRAGVSSTAIYKRLRRSGVEIRKKRGASKREAIVADYASGLTYSQVAVKHGRCVSGTRKIIIESGVPLRPISESRLRGDLHPMWRGGVRKSADGYLVTKDGRQHRQKAELLIGRRLHFWEAVHHVDANKTNNDDSNLVIMPTREHQRFHSFLLHRGLPTNAENLARFCRHESRFYARFTKEDAERADSISPMAGRSPISKRRGVCNAPGCSQQRCGNGFCSKHYQRLKAIQRGFWLSGKGRKSPCLIKRIYSKNDAMTS